MTVDSWEFMLCRLRVQRRSNETSYLIGLRKGGGGVIEVTCMRRW